MSEPSTLRQSLDQFKNSLAAANADGSLSFSDYLRLIADGAQIVEAAIRGIATDDEQFNLLVIDCEQFVQEYIVPINLSKFGVPPMVERFMIDPQLVPSVRPALEALRASILNQQQTKNN